MTTILRALLLSLVCACPLSAKAPDLTLVRQLPQRLAEMKKEGHKKWDIGNTVTMVEGTVEYNDKLIAILKELVGAYATKSFIKESDVDAYVKIVTSKIKFEQKLENPHNLDQGTLASHYIPCGLTVELENAIVGLVRGVVEYEQFDFDAWHKEWKEAQKVGD